MLLIQNISTQNNISPRQNKDNVAVKNVFSCLFFLCIFEVYVTDFGCNPLKS